MRPLTIALVLCSACATAELPDPLPSTVRDRLDRPTRLSISASDSAGLIAAERRSPDGGWDAQWVDLVITEGELLLSADEHGVISIERLVIALAPITIPESVLAGGAQLTDLMIELTRPTVATTTWSGDNEAHATSALEIRLGWALVVGGAHLPLGAPMLPPIPLELVATGTGRRIDADVRLSASGELWDWAELFRLSELTLALDAATP